MPKINWTRKAQGKLIFAIVIALCLGAGGYLLWDTFFKQPKMVATLVVPEAQYTPPAELTVVEKLQLLQFKVEQHLTDDYIKNLRKADAEIYCMAVNNFWEARGESFLGKVLVSQVVYNRLNMDTYPNSACAVVYQQTYKNNRVVCQFSWHCNKNLSDSYREKLIKNNLGEEIAWRESIAAAIIVRDGLLEEAVTCATHYYDHKKVRPRWSKTNELDRKTTFGNHTFLSKGSPDNC